MEHRFIKDGKLDRAPLIAELRSFMNLLLAQMRLDVQFDIKEFPGTAGDEVEQPEVLVTFRGASRNSSCNSMPSCCRPSSTWRIVACT